jgi:hypothetical protein
MDELQHLVTGRSLRCERINHSSTEAVNPALKQSTTFAEAEIPNFLFAYYFGDDMLLRPPPPDPGYVMVEDLLTINTKSEGRSIVTNNPGG